MKGYCGWAYQPFYTMDQQARKQMPFIAALRPGDGVVEIEWYDPAVHQREHIIQIWDETGACTSMAAAGSHVQVTGLENGKTYTFAVADREDPERCSEKRRAGIAPVVGLPVNYLHPMDECYSFSGHSLCSPSILRLNSGTMLVSMDVYKHLRGQNLTKIFASYDDGKTWHYQTDLFPCFWGKLFEFRGALYMLAFTTEYGNMIIGRSEDEGRTWTDFVTLFPGSGNRYCGGPHRAPLNILEHEGRLWTAVDFGTWEKNGHSSGVMSVSVDADLLDPASWTVSDFLNYDPSWEGAAVGESKGCLEGNMVLLPDGTLCNFLRYQIQQCQPSYDRAMVLKVDPAHPEKKLEFYRVIEFMGGLTKFSITFDPVTGRYVALINRVVNPQKPMARNVLSLVYSEDAIHWHYVQDVVDCSDYENAVEKIGMQYPDLAIDGEDLVWVQRTAMNNATNFHDSNYITFHRLCGFRRLIGTK